MWPIEAHEVLEIIHEEGNEEYVPVEKKAKQKKHPWSEKNMSEALNSCKNQEMGIEEASIIYGIPRRSLRSRLKDKNFSVIDEKYRVFVLPFIPVEAEEELVHHIQELIQSQFSLTSTEIRRIGYELISEKYQLNDLPREKNCLLGNIWYRKFIGKYAHLGLEQAEANQDKSANFYNSLEKLINDNHIDSNRIFCVDGIELKFRASDSQDLENIYHRRKIIYTDSKAICCISAAGTFFPPVFIKPQEKGSFGENLNEGQNGDSIFIRPVKIGSGYVQDFKDLTENDSGLLPTAEEISNIKNQIKAHLKKKIEPTTEEHEEEFREKLYEQFNKLRNKIMSKYEDSLNNISTDMFHEWLKNFIFCIKPNNQEKVVLVVGEQSFIKCVKTLQLAKANGVLFLVLPPHSIHKIHPLDGFAMSLNRNLSTCASVWLGKNPHSNIQHVPLDDLFKQAYKLTINPTIAKNGFMYSGIWPINRTVFKSTELGGESMLLKNSLPYRSNLKENSSHSAIAELRNGLPEVIDMEKLCRVCMKEKIYMKPLFEGEEANYYGKKISEIVKKVITLKDGLPRNICQYCLVQLKDFVKIRTLAIESNEKLLKVKETLTGCIYSNDGCDNLCQLETHSKFLEKFVTKESDTYSVCRICMSEKLLLTSIFRESYPNLIPDLSMRIATVADCQVHVEDGLPLTICPFCRTSISHAWEFIEKAVSSDRRFREILGQNYS